MSNQVQLLLLALLILFSVGGLAAEDKAAHKGKLIDYQANLAKVPTTDPKPDQPVEVVKVMVGQHPRLLFTLKELEALKLLVDQDSVLKESLEDTVKATALWPFPKAHPDVVGADDTPAIWKSGGTYPGLAYAYHLGKDATAKQKILGILTTMLAEPYWGNSADLDCTMGAGNNLMMMGILFDAVASELDADLRGKLAAKILTHVRRMWYLGHKCQAVGTIKYWQNDPQNNHRWHRDAGMAASLCAIADEPGIDTGYMLEQFKGEMDFIAKWLPPDGDCHEGAGYQGFGFMRLALAMLMMDRVLGTTYQKTAVGLQHAWAQQIYWWAPGRIGNMSFGDDANGEGGGFNWDNAGFFVGPQLSRDKLAQAALTLRMQTMRQKKDGMLPWDMLTFYDPTLAGGDHLSLPTRRLLSDLGAASMRDSWKPEAVALTFKCGPYGGAKLNEFAMSTGKWAYTNVAHDDPDANSFSLGMDGDLVFHPGVYSMPKWTESNSTILVDGKGQVKEGSDYTQPVHDVDMRTLSYLTGWKEGEGGRTIIEGETGKAYQGRLKRFRRTAIYLPGDYILLMDSIASDKKHSITWLGVTSKGKIEDAAAGRAIATGKGGKSVAMQIAADTPLVGEIKPYKVTARWGDLQTEQIRFTADAEAVHFACVLDPWQRKPVLTLKKADSGMTVTVTVGDKADTWTWCDAIDDKAPSSVAGLRGDKPLLVLMTKDQAPVAP